MTEVKTDNTECILNDYVKITSSDWQAGKRLDTQMQLVPENFTVAGDDIIEFAKELEKLIDKYRI
jgi:hypothetical protein